MNNSLVILVLSAIVVSGATQSASLASTTLRVTGTIDKFDAATRILSLSTANGTVRFTLASTARLRRGWHRIEPADLEKLAGDRATVRYSESAGSKTVQSVHVFDTYERSAP